MSPDFFRLHLYNLGGHLYNFPGVRLLISEYLHSSEITEGFVSMTFVISTY